MGIRTVVVCPNCGKPFTVQTEKKTTYVNCPVCNKSILVKGKEKTIKIVCCPKCKTYQATRATAKFKCRICGHSDRMNALNVYMQTLNARIAVEAVKKLNESRMKRGER